MGQRAWFRSLCSLPRPCPFLLLLLLLAVPRRAQPQAGRVSTAPLPCMWPRVPGKRPERGPQRKGEE